MEHHEVALAKFTATALEEGALAVILTGSVARGTERPDSDVDVYLVVDDDTFADASATDRLSYVVSDDVGYDGGYIDIKLATLEYLDKAADAADDPTRASLLGARVAAATVDGIPSLVERITSPPEPSWDAKAASFIAQAQLYGEYFLPHGESKGDRFLLAHAATHLALAAARAIFAHNRMLFRGPKYVSAMLREAPDIPPGFPEAIDALLEHPGTGTASIVLDKLYRFRAWPLEREKALSRFVEDNELAWLHRRMPPEYG